MIQVRRAQADEVNFPSQVHAYVNPYHVISLMPKSKAITTVVMTNGCTLDVAEEITLLASRIDKATGASE